MRGLARLAALLAAAALVAGCFEGKADFSLNPDGTGKVVGELLFPSRAPWLQKRYSARPADPNAAPEPVPDPEEEMRECVAATIKRSVGIDAWKDVSFQRAADGRVKFKGTAYFKDLSKVRIYPDDRTRISFGPDGTTALLLILNRAKPVTEPPKPAGPTSGEDITRRLKEIRDRYQQAKSTVTTELPGMKVALVFHSSGTLEESRGLEQQGPTLSYAVEGGRIVQAMEAQMTDGTVIKQWALAGKAPSPKEMMNEKVFGAKGEVWARWKGPFRQCFDYQAEMGAAKKAQPAMMAKLGLEKPRDTSPRPPSAPAAPKNSPAPKKDAGPAKSPAPAPKGLPSMPMPAAPPAIPTPLVPLF